MDTVNTQAIIDLIRKDAKDAADTIIAEAKDRAATISEHSASRIQQQVDEIRSQAAADADILEDRMHRLAELENRKLLVAQKRGLIDEAFRQAIAKLNALPTSEVSNVMLDLLTKHASGTEKLAAGSVNDGFFTEAFVDEANQRLTQAGKPGELTALVERVPGVCGLVLKDVHSQMHCTFSSLLEVKRESLEAQVVSILFA